MSEKVIAERDILSVLSLLTRERGATSWIDKFGERVYERSRLFEVLNDTAFRVDDEEVPDIADGSGRQDREQESEPEARELRGRQAAVAPGHDDGVVVGRKIGLGRRLDADEGKLKIAQTALAQAKRKAESRSSRSGRRRGRGR